MYRPAGKPAQVTDGKVADHVQEETSTHIWMKRLMREGANDVYVDTVDEG